MTALHVLEILRWVKVRPHAPSLAQLEPNEFWHDWWGFFF